MRAEPVASEWRCPDCGMTVAEYDAHLQASRHAGAPKPCPDVSDQPQPVSLPPVGPEGTR